MGGAKELANYGEYSGAPSEQQTYEYARTLLSLMTKKANPQGRMQQPSEIAWDNNISRAG